MNSLKNFKRLIIEGKQSPLQNDTRLPVDLKIPEITESAYKILNRKKIREDGKKEHSIAKKQQIRIPSKSGNSSPLKIGRCALGDLTKDLHNTETSLHRTGDPKLRLLQLTQQEFECLEGMINAQKQTNEKRLKEAQKLRKIHEKISTLWRECRDIQQLSDFGRGHHNSQQTQVLFLPSPFEDSNTTDLNESTTTAHQLRQWSNWREDNLHQKSGIEFKKIMYILESKGLDDQKLHNPKKPTNSYCLISGTATPSIRFRGQARNSPKRQSECRWCRC